ncbi:MAG: hypothetical protein AB4040_15610 [Synechococcus sp.]
MASLFSGLLSFKSSDWCKQVKDPLRVIEHFYKTRTDIPLSKRREISRQSLCKIKGLTPHLAKVILNQWDETSSPRPNPTPPPPPSIPDPRNTRAALHPTPSPRHTPSVLQPTPKPVCSSTSSLLDPDDLRSSPPSPPPLLGQALLKAGLVRPNQILVALNDAKYREDLKIGEILALRGWIQQETADFFAEVLPNLPNTPKKEPIGQYLKTAKLLTQKQIDNVLTYQRNNPVKFGETAVALRYLKKQTLNYVLDYVV